ncbi:MAG: FAD:protein FMN transferase [Bacteroidaceae bacterium]|nr:FAD:protein FMN transferase [Bacteroidaceae bacterium]
MKRPVLSLFFLLLLIVGTFFILRNAKSKQYMQLSGKAFGTIYHITYHSSRPLQQEVEATLQQVDATFSMFNPHSLVARINAGADTTLNDAFIEVFDMAQQVSEQTQGAFDITVAPLVNAWGFGTKGERQPSQQQIDSLLQCVGYGKVKLHGQRLQRTDKRLQLDFSAIAKGYACDALAHMMRHNGVDNFMIEIGGEVVCQGVNEKGKRWRIAVQQPKENASEDQEYQAILTLCDQAVATSGNYRNFYYKDGRRYAHTIDPHTGRPVQHSLLSATVVAPQCARADAYATAFMVMGLQKAQQFMQQHADLQALLVYEDAQGRLLTWATPKLKKAMQ